MLGKDAHYIMKAVATALVLIVGAAVVLWYGNTLNSWVLGGLIGGLAALLISIPISLTLFSYLSRRHEDAHGEEIQGRVSLAQTYEYQDDARSRAAYADEVEGSLYAIDNESWHEDEEAFYSRRPASDYPSSVQQRNPLQERNYTLKKLPVPRYSPDGPIHRSSSSASGIPAKTSQGRRTTRHLPPTTSMLSQHRSQALRAARREALQHFDDSMETPTRTLSARPLPPDRPTRSQPVSRRPPVTRRASRQLDSQAANLYPKQPRQRSEERGVTHYERQRSAPLQDKSTGRVLPDRQVLDKNFIPDNYPQTEPINRSTQSGRLKRDIHRDDPYYEPEVTTEGLQRPLVRRAPYMYEDDPLRQELSQYSDNPVMRRSSRYDMMQQDGLEE
jgi:hypothetical protein